jgi:hypothetical protein
VKTIGIKVFILIGWISSKIDLIKIKHKVALNISGLELDLPHLPLFYFETT